MNEPPTLGVEEEFALVDARRQALVGRAGELLGRIDPLRAGRIEHEMKLSQVETATPVCHDLTQVRTHLGALRHSVVTAARAMRCDVLAGGTHPLAEWYDQALTPKPAYARIEDQYQRLSHEQLIFGCHVHVAVHDPDLRIAVLDRVRTRLAPLLALTANSPYWEGDDTGYASYRYIVFSRWPTFSTPEALGDWAGYQSLVSTLVGAGAIDSPGRLYWTVRPSAAYPTLEFRVADVCTTVEETVMLAGLCRALVTTAIEEIHAGSPPPEVRGETIRMAMWQAARYGLRGELIDPVDGTTHAAADAVSRLIEHLGPALERSGDLHTVTSTITAVLHTGNGADRQRRIMADTGSMQAVLRSLSAHGGDHAATTSVR